MKNVSILCAAVCAFYAITAAGCVIDLGLMDGPEAPADFSASEITSSSVTLSWSGFYSSTAYFEITRSQSDSSVETVISDTITGSSAGFIQKDSVYSYIDTDNLDQGTSYTYRITVFSYNMFGDTMASSQTAVCVTIPFEKTDPARPLNVQAVLADSYTTNSGGIPMVNITWEAPSGFDESPILYTIYWKNITDSTYAVLAYQEDTVYSGPALPDTNSSSTGSPGISYKVTASYKIDSVLLESSFSAAACIDIY